MSLSSGVEKRAWMDELCISLGGPAGLWGFLCSRVAVGPHKLHVHISGGDAQMMCCDNRAAKHLGTCWKTLWSRDVVTEQGLEEICVLLGLKIIERDELIIIYVCATFKNRFMYVIHSFLSNLPSHFLYL